MKVIPVPGEPALLLEPGSKKAGRTLVVADIHLGYESSLHRAGVHLPSRTQAKLKHLLKLLRRMTVDRLVLLGDVKHTIGGISYLEKEELPDFLQRLSSKVEKVDIVLGNHDGLLREITPETVGVHPHLVLEDVGLVHGHSWPPSEVMECGTIVFGHDHPTLVFIDELGQRNFYPCWMRSKMVLSKAGKRYAKVKGRATGIVMPAFDDLGRGTPVNLKGVKLLGPLLTNQVLDLASADIHLLDGTYLGPLSEIMVTDQRLLGEFNITKGSPEALGSSCRDDKGGEDGGGEGQ